MSTVTAASRPLPRNEPQGLAGPCHATPKQLAYTDANLVDLYRRGYERHERCTGGAKLLHDHFMTTLGRLPERGELVTLPPHDELTRAPLRLRAESFIEPSRRDDTGITGLLVGLFQPKGASVSLRQGAAPKRDWPTREHVEKFRAQFLERYYTSEGGGLEDMKVWASTAEMSSSARDQQLRGIERQRSRIAAHVDRVVADFERVGRLIAPSSAERVTFISAVERLEAGPSRNALLRALGSNDPVAFYDALTAELRVYFAHFADGGPNALRAAMLAHGGAHLGAIYTAKDLAALRNGG